MANTYSQLTVQAVFAVKHRENFITNSWRDELHKYIYGIGTNINIKVLAVGGWKDHVHIFFGLPETMCVANIVKTIKSNSSKWINERRFIPHKFNWQEGYGSFSYSKDQRDTVIKYII